MLLQSQNKGAETPYLLQSWVDNIDGKSRAPIYYNPTAISS
ncbi:hypothetical protein [Escherichia coli]